MGEIMATGKTVETHRAVVHPWLCDGMGHLTTRHYVAMFDDAAWHLLLIFGATPSQNTATKRGWADVRHEIDYHHEVAMGEMVVVLSSLVRVGEKSVSYKHELRNAETQTLCATMTATTVRFDLVARKSVPIEPELKQALLAGLATA